MPHSLCTEMNPHFAGLHKSLQHGTSAFPNLHMRSPTGCGDVVEKLEAAPHSVVGSAFPAREQQVNEK